MPTASFARTSIWLGLALGLAAQAAMAAPLLDITKPPVASGANPSTGPAIDPTASDGQWFQTVGSGTLVHRKQEFYDNQTGNGGGPASTAAIQGHILPGSLILDGNNDVIGFTVRTTITNDLPPIGPWADGTNSHGETLHTDSLARDLHGVALTAEFADDGVRGNFSTAGAPYFGPESNIFAKNYNELAWYSYTNTGAFQVPTWDFGDIPLGASVSRDLEFGLYTAVSQASIQYLIDATDIFMNRTTDLKIGDYFEKGTGVGASYEGLAADDGSAYPVTINRSGNVSVFAQVPEPASLALLAAGLAGFAATGRRKKA